MIEFGASVVISGSRPETSSAAVQRLRAAYPEVKDDQLLAVSCNLLETDGLEEELQDLFKVASEDGSKRIDHIVFTAGDVLDVAGGITGTTAEVIHAILAVRVYAPALIAKTIATTGYVNKSYETSFTMTSGTAHLQPRKTWGMISMASGAIQGLAAGLAVDLAPVRVNVVNPGIFDTELLQHAPSELMEMFKEDSVTKRFGRPEEIAEAYLYFMKDYSADGTSLISDNGKVIAP